MFKIFLANKNGKSITHEEIHISGEPIDYALKTIHPVDMHGSFKSFSSTVTGTDTIVSIREGQGIVLTDLMLFAKKSAGGDIIVEFTDGTETISIIEVDTKDFPVRFSMPFRFGWKGWENAQLQLRSTGNIDRTISIGYYIVKNALNFNEWDVARN